jgi:hypothetical protein
MFQNLLGTLSLKFNDALLYASSTNTSTKAWSLDKFFNNVIELVKHYGGYLLIIIGTAALIYSIIQAFRKYVFQSQEVRTGPVTMILGAVFGAAFMIGGWGLANSIGQGLSDSAKGFGEGTSSSNTILMFLDFKLNTLGHYLSNLR